MTDSPSSNDDRELRRQPSSMESDPGSPDSPLLFGVTLWRESVLALLGTLSLLAGLNGW